MVINHKITVDDCSIIELPKISDPAGNLSPIHEEVDIPFKIKRVFYLYDIPSGKKRGGHAHKKCHQFLIAGSGSFSVEINDGVDKKKYYLDRPYKGLFIPAGLWASENHFSSGSICLVLASELFMENDYIRNFETYEKLKLKEL